jgi:thymidylate synthase (FAD)
MPKILTYKDSKVKLLYATPNPAGVVGLAVAMTMKQDLHDTKPITSKLCKFLVNAEHTSLLEHVVYTFQLENYSRSFLAQITRQRMSSFTSASQHYQGYSDYPCVVAPETNADDLAFLDTAFARAYSTYDYLSDVCAIEEARQVLPNAAAVNLLWTINARSLMLFLKHRLCNRNVLEMRIFAHKILNIVQCHFPELFNLAGPQCVYPGRCQQGKLQCKEGTWKRV